VYLTHCFRQLSTGNAQGKTNPGADSADMYWAGQSCRVIEPEGGSCFRVHRCPQPNSGLHEEFYRRDSSLSVPAARDNTPVNFFQYFEVTFPSVFLLAFGTSRQSHALEFPGVRPGPLDLAG
jgi:hypothetical protein